MTLTEAITLLLMVAKAFPELSELIGDIFTAIKLELSGKEMTEEEKTEIATLFDKADSELEKACAERLKNETVA